MKRLLVAVLLAGCGAASAAPAAVEPERPRALSPEVSVRVLAPGVWLVTSLAPAEHAFPGYPANALVVEREGGATLLDTTWTPAEAEQVLTWASERGHPVTEAIVTHFHDDRVGGAAALVARGLPVYALNETAERAAATGTPFVHVALEPESIPGLRWMFPGAGHSPENIVVWHEASGTLFGGCFVKSLEATDLGNLADADVTGWEAAVMLVIESYPEAVHVVPGHGAPGDRALLDHTLALVDPPECATDADCRVLVEDLSPCSCCGCVGGFRVMSEAAYAAETEMRISCEPICDGAVCPSCPSVEEREHTFAVCRDGDCALEVR